MEGLLRPHMVSDLNGFLEQNCSLTKRQIECLTLQISARNRVRDGEKGEKPYEVGGVSEGSYYRVLGQAKKNINQALYTMVLCSRMGLIQGVDLNRLLNLMSKVPLDNSEASGEVISLVEALVTKIVML